MATEKPRPSRTVPLYFDIFVVLASTMFGLVYGSYYKFPGNVLGPIGGALTGFGWCYLIRLWLQGKKAYPAIIAGLIMGILAGLISTFIINVHVFFGMEEADYCNTFYAWEDSSIFRDVDLISSPVFDFFSHDGLDDFLSRAFWTGGVMGGYLGLIGGVLYGVTNKFHRRMSDSKYWPSPKLDLFYCIATAVVYGFLLMAIADKPYFFITFPTVLLIFGAWVTLKRYVCRRINLWPFCGVLPLYIIDNACLILVCVWILSSLAYLLVYLLAYKSLIIGGAWGLFWGLIFAINKKFFYRVKLEKAEAGDG